MNDDVLNEIAGFIALLTIVPATLNAAIYGVGSAWYKSWLGRVLFAKWLAVALVFVFIIARRTLGEFDGYGLVAILLYAFVLLAFSATTVELIIERRKPAPSPPEIERTRIMSHTNENKPSIIDRVGEYRKAIAAFVVPALTVLGAALIPDVDGTVVVTLSEWVGVAIAALGTSTVVAAVRNDEYTG